MSGKWKVKEVQRPATIPCTVTVSCEQSTQAFVPKHEFERNGEWRFIIGPALVGSPICTKRLTLSYERAPILDHQFFPVGEIEPGKLPQEEKSIYLFLEK
ncbi:MAG: hypothetical protein Q8Q67_01930 [bacterium]|nr:hypothetical protein [bacterium]